MRADLAAGADPSETRKVEKAAQGDTFEAVAREWLGTLTKMKPTTVEQLRHRLDVYAFPTLGSRPIRPLSNTPKDVLALLRRIDVRGRHETAARVRSLCGRVFRYASANGRADIDPTADLKGALTSQTTRHFAAITDEKRVGELLRAIDDAGRFDE